MKYLTLLLTGLSCLGAGTTGLVAPSLSPLSGGGTGSATNAIGNNNGLGTNTSLYGTTTVNGPLELSGQTIDFGIASNLWSVYTPEMFGAVVDGAANDTVPVQTCESYVESLIHKGIGAKTLLAPKSTNGYLITGLILTNTYNIEGSTPGFRTGLAPTAPTFTLLGTNGIIMTNQNVYGGLIKNVQVVGSNYVATGSALAGQYGIKLSSTNINSSQLSLINVSVIGFDYGIVSTNINEPFYDGIYIAHCTNSLIMSGGFAGNSSSVNQAGWIRAYIDGYGPGTVLDGNNSGLDVTGLLDNGTDSSHKSVNALTIRGAANVTLLNCNLENTSDDATHYPLYIDNSTVKIYRGTLLPTNSHTSFLLTNGGSLEIHGVTLNSDANGVYGVDWSSGKVFGDANWTITNAFTAQLYQSSPFPSFVENIVNGTLSVRQGGNNSINLGADQSTVAGNRVTLTVNSNKSGTIFSYPFNGTSATVLDVYARNVSGDNGLIFGGQTDSGLGAGLNRIDMVTTQGTWRFDGNSDGNVRGGLVSETQGNPINLWGGPIMWAGTSDDPNKSISAYDQNGGIRITVTNATGWGTWQTSGVRRAVPIFGNDVWTNAVVKNPISINSVYTVGFAPGLLTVNYLMSEAVGGTCYLLYTNLTRATGLTITNNLSLSAGASGSFTVKGYPNERVACSNLSSGGAAVSIISSEFDP